MVSLLTRLKRLHHILRKGRVMLRLQVQSTATGWHPFVDTPALTIRRNSHNNVLWKMLVTLTVYLHSYD